MSSSQSAELRAEAQAAADAKPSVARVEDTGARTKTSRTLLDPVSGTRFTEFSSMAINYQDAKGAWLPVDNRVVASADATGNGKAGWRNGGNKFSLGLPQTLTDPLVLRDSADTRRWVSLELAPEKASGGAESDVADVADVVGRVAGSAGAAAETVRYPGVLPGVEVAFAATGDGVKETATLASLAAVDALPGKGLTYTLRVPSGFTARQSGQAGPQGQVVEVVAVGAKAEDPAVWEIPAAWMNDATGAYSDAVTTTLTRDAASDVVSDAGGVQAWTVSVTPDREWLAAAGRVWPVVVDPTIGFPDPMLGCTIASATTSQCTGGELPVSWQTAGNAQRRVPLRFDTVLDVVPADAQVAHAYLNLHVINDAGFSASPVDVRGLTNSFTSAATWTMRSATFNWNAAGGDRTSTVYATKTLSPNGSYQPIEVTQLVQDWAEGNVRHFGFMIEKPAATANGSFLRISSPASGNAPSLTVEWDPRTGARKGNTAAITQQLSDRTSVTINPATGNAAVSTKELTLEGVGLDLNVAHTSQSLDTYGLGVLGYGWSTSVGSTRLIPDGGVAGQGSLFYIDGSGGQWTWQRDATGALLRPKGLDADLSNSAGVYTLTERKSKVARKFKNIGDASTGPIYGLDTIKDRNGNTITFTYDASARSQLDGTLLLRSVTDTRGRVLSIANLYGYFNSTVTDHQNRNVVYTMAGNDLDKITDADGGTVDYDYDPAHRVKSVKVPGGQQTTMVYDSDGKITELKRIAPAEGNPTWTISYAAYARDSNGVPSRITTVTDPEGHTTKYTANGRGLVAKVVDGRGETRDKTYSPNDDAATSTDATNGPGGAQATDSYDTTGDTFRLTSSTQPTGATSTYTHGTGALQYELTKTDGPRNSETDETYAYDGNGNRTTTTRNTGVNAETTVNLYEGSTDAANGNAVVHCGNTGSPPVATKPGVLCETRDPLWSSASPTLHRTLYRYDSLGQLTTMIPPASAGLSNWTYTWDALSRLATVTDGKGQTTTYGYDAMDRKVYVKHHDNSTENYYFGTAGNNGWLNSLDEYAPNGTTLTRHTVYGRDNLGRQLNQQTPEGNISMTYDKVDNLTTYNDTTVATGAPGTGGQIGYGYNEANQLTTLQLPGGDCTGRSWNSPGAASLKCVVFNVDKDGRRTGVKYPGTSTFNFQNTVRDTAGRVSQIIAKTGGASGTTRLDLTYNYNDPAIPGTGSKDTGLVFGVTEAAPTSGTTTYTHDGSDRVTVASTGGASPKYERFCYDKAGNRTRYYRATAVTDCTTGTPAATSTYNSANQLATTTGADPTGTAMTGGTPAYDANGNETASKSTPGRTATYGDRDQTSGFTTGGSTYPQGYGATGNLDRVTTGVAGGTTLQPGPLAPAPSWSKTGTTTTWAVRDPDGQLIAVRIGTTSTPLSATDYFPFTDRQGNVRALVTATGTTPNVAYTYSTYGTTLTTTGSLVQPYRYGSGYTDDTTKLIKLGVRYYDTTHGRFTQPDPTKQEQHPYLYGTGCPSTFSDPTGAFSTAVCTGSAAAVGGFAGFTGALAGGVAGGLIAGTATGGFIAGACLSKSSNPRQRAIDGLKGAGTALVIDVFLAGGQAIAEQVKA